MGGNPARRMGYMNKPLILYSIFFVALGLAFWQPSLAWLAPISILVLLVGTIWLWGSEGRSIQDLGLHHVASWHRNVLLGNRAYLAYSASIRAGCQRLDYIGSSTMVGGKSDKDFVTGSH